MKLGTGIRSAFELFTPNSDCIVFSHLTYVAWSPQDILQSSYITGRNHMEINFKVLRNTCGHRLS